MASGHIMIYKDGRYQYQHILNAEKKIGRKLRPSEIVHHKNGRPSDNRPENLVVMTRGEHNTVDPQHHNGGRYAGDKAGDK